MADKKRADEFAEGKERIEEIGSRLSPLFGKTPSSAGSGFLSGLGSLIEQLGVLAELAEKTVALCTHPAHLRPDQGVKKKGVYGFKVKSAIGDKPPKVKQI